MNKWFAKDEMIKKFKKYSGFFVKWLLISSFVGILIGILVLTLYFLVLSLTEVRNKYWFSIFALPFAGAAAAYLYKLMGQVKYKDINLPILAIRSDKRVPIAVAPLIYIATLLTHISGASAGIIDSAVQLGASIADGVGGLIKLNNNDRRTIIMCAASAAFSAILGAPLTGTVLVMEISNVGYMYYAALLPCAISSVAGSFIGKLAGFQYNEFRLDLIPEISVTVFLKVILLAMVCAFLVRIFCSMTETIENVTKLFIRDKVKRGLIGGIVLLFLALLVGGDYLGLGFGTIEKAIGGYARPEAFLIKMLLTAITIAAGFKGGGIIPAFFIGAAFGAFIAPIIGLPASLCAALALVAFFCGITNCPTASVVLGLEFFGVGGAMLILIVVAIVYPLSGYGGLYKEQKLMFSKVTAYPVKEDADI